MTKLRTTANRKPRNLRVTKPKVVKSDNPPDSRDVARNDARAHNSRPVRDCRCLWCFVYRKVDARNVADRRAAAAWERVHAGDDFVTRVGSNASAALAEVLGASGFLD